MKAWGRMIGMREDEELCKDAVLSHVQSLGHQASVEPGEKNKAPDYVLTMDGTEYALEVTTAMDKINVPGVGLLPRAGVHAGLAQLTAKIKRRAEAAGFLAGHLDVSHVGGWVIEDLSKRSEQIILDVLAFLRDANGG